MLNHQTGSIRPVNALELTRIPDRQNYHPLGNASEAYSVLNGIHVENWTLAYSKVTLKRKLLSSDLHHKEVTA